ncbi:regulatory signaling modulator protein AmpE, partial [Klebsiella pneumoniae]|uniref:regulatory signaling modulator protein AmpE n=1 Tax=Klebsiella pneumoniae TaxID=573 RepID=UPI000E3EADCB
RLFKLGEHWQLDHRLEAFFRRVKHFSLGRTLCMTIIAMGVTFLLLRALQGVLFNVPTLLVWLLIGLLCIGAGKVRLHYHAYLTAASRNDRPVTLMGYAFLRAWQYWLARYQTPHHRLQSGIDAVLHALDWVPVRLAGVVYALIGHGEKALPAWFASLGDFHTSQYQVLTRLAQFSLA